MSFRICQSNSLFYSLIDKKRLINEFSKFFLSGTFQIIWKYRIICVILLLTIQGNSQAASRKSIDTPVLTGPQYPLTYFRNRFEPDSGFLLTEDFVQTTLKVSISNSFGFTINNDKFRSPNGNAEKFNEGGAVAPYSVYIDSERIERSLQLRWNISEFLEVQFVYREVLYQGGFLDHTIDGFHDAVNLGNMGRDKTPRSQFEIYVWDNEEKKHVFQFKNPSDQFLPEAQIIALKFPLHQGESQGFSFKIASNFNDPNLEEKINEVESATNSRPLDDVNLSFYYSILFEVFSVHFAYSQTRMKVPIFEKGPDIYYYYFSGANWYILDSFVINLQALFYSSIYTNNQSYNLGENVREITGAVRQLWDDMALEVGFVENNTQGPNNIDISFFTHLSFIF